MKSRIERRKCVGGSPTLKLPKKKKKNEKKNSTKILRLPDKKGLMYEKKLSDLKNELKNILELEFFPKAR